MRPPRYVGVSGVTTPDQAQDLLDAWPADAPSHSLMLGVLASQRTMTGGERNARSADPALFKSIFEVDRPFGRKTFRDGKGMVRVTRTLNLIHYFTKNTADLGEQLLHACAPAGELCDGVQINVPWPPPSEIAHFMEYGGWERVVLQVGPNAIEALPSTAAVLGLTLPEALAFSVDQYEGLITDVLIDGSGGHGRPLDYDYMRLMVEALQESLMSDLGITIAGGLCAEALPGVASLVRQYDLSLDAEGRLRDDQGQLDMEEACRWLRAAAPLVCYDS